MTNIVGERPASPAPARRDRFKVALLVLGGALALAGSAMFGYAATTARAAHGDGVPIADLSWQIAGAGVLIIAAGVALILCGGFLPLESPRSEPSGTYPVSLDAHLDEPLSRWLWLVKWFLLIPHGVSLASLWIAFGVLTAVAFVAILLTGRYPGPLFATNAGILRWSVRVAFYGYGALATDRYPPFTLVDVDYPVRLAVAQPGRLSRGLALVKWWLLAIPHYLIVAVFSGSSPGNVNEGVGGTRTTGGLVPILVLIAGVALLFTGRYPRGIFDLLMGLQRWIYRVVTYVTLMHDEYPPFRVDLGGEETPAPRDLNAVTSPAQA